MKKHYFLVVFMLISIGIFAQNSDVNEAQMSGTAYTSKPTTALNVGVLMGGGSLLGADFEYMPSTRVGLQAGMGISSFGLGLNYHLKNQINSSFLSFQYWHQGFGDNHYASYLGPMFVFRAKKVFQAGLGVGAVLDKGAAYTSTTDVSVALLFNIGVYFPL